VKDHVHFLERKYGSNGGGRGARFQRKNRAPTPKPPEVLEKLNALLEDHGYGLEDGGEIEALNF
jgi:hypothetical protein